VPCGSGNDFARALKLGRIPASLEAWRKFCSGSGNVRSIDLGVITPLTAEHCAAQAPALPRYFCCVGSVGLDAEISRRANRLPRWLRAHGGYALSLLPALSSFTPVRMTISVLHEEHRDFVVDRKPIMVAAFANAPSYGGGMKIAPRAQLDDGKLDVCIIKHMDKMKLFCLFPSVYFGRHLNVPQVEYSQAERLVFLSSSFEPRPPLATRFVLGLETDEPHDVYADGEYICQTPIEVSVARGALRVIVP